MNSSFFNISYCLFLFIIVFTLFICIFFLPFSSSFPETFGISNSINYPIDISNCDFVWPIPGYSKITSPYGKRNLPTVGASSFHKGIDIGAPEGTNLFAIIDGKITFVDFFGGGGYTITLTHDNIKITYCHVSPNFIVNVGDTIYKGQLIAHVGPKYVYNIPNNPYKDSNGKPTNGATTGCHLHLGVRVNDNYIDPMSLFE